MVTVAVFIGWEFYQSPTQGLHRDNTVTLEIGRIQMTVMTLKFCKRQEFFT